MATKKLKAIWKEYKPKEDAVFDGTSSRISTGRVSQEGNPVDITVGKDGSLYLSGDSDGIVYLYPEQVPHLKAAVMKAQQILNGKKRKSRQDGGT